VRKKVYVASPISKGDLTGNIVLAHRAGMALLQAGFAPLVPHGSCFWGNDIAQCRVCEKPAFHPEATHSDVSHETWLDMDLAWVAVADGVLRLPGESVGADKEVAFALEKGIPVFTSIEDAVSHFINKKQGAANATARPADAGTAADGSAGSVGGNAKQRTWEQRLERACKITASKKLLKFACEQFVRDFAVDDAGATIGDIGSVSAAAEIFFEALDEDHRQFRADTLAMLRGEVMKKAEAVLSKIFG
jgi:hypothetical protein